MTYTCKWQDADDASKGGEFEVTADDIREATRICGGIIRREIGLKPKILFSIEAKPWHFIMPPNTNFAMFR